MSDTKSIIERYFAAVHEGDAAAMRDVLHPKLAFKGPIDEFDNAEDLITSLGKLAQIVDHVVPQRMFFDGDEACVVYDLVTKTPAGTSHVAEWFRTSDGKITSIRVHFDARPFAAMFGAG